MHFRVVAINVRTTRIETGCQNSHKLIVTIDEVTIERAITLLAQFTDIL